MADKNPKLFLAPIGETELSHEYFFNSHFGFCEAGRIRDHSSITPAKKWVGGVRKWQFLMIYSTVNHQRGGRVGLKKSKTWWRNTWMPPYQNYEQPCQTSQNSEIQSHFLVSKIGGIFPKKKFCEEYLIRRPTCINDIFWKLWFLKYFIY